MNDFGKIPLSIILILTTSLVLTLSCPVFAQSNNLDSILKNAQKSLEDSTNSSIPKNRFISSTDYLSQQECSKQC